MPLSCQEELSPQGLSLTHSQPVLFVTSQWPLPGWRYVSYRAVAALVSCGWMVYGLVMGASWRSALFLTSWGFALLCVSTLWQAAIAGWGYSQLRDREADPPAPLQTMPWFLKGAWVMYNIVTCGSMIITLVYWPLLFHAGGDKIDAMNFILHGANSIYVLVDILIVATPIRLLHVWHTMTLGLAYTLVNVIYTTQSGDVLYPILDWVSKPGEAAMYSALITLVLAPTMWLLVYGMYRLRVALFGRCFHSGPGVSECTSTDNLALAD